MIKKKNNKKKQQQLPEVDRNVYRKIGRKYEPIGIQCSGDWFGDGLYLIRHNGCSLINADYYASKWGLTKVADLPKTDLTQFATAAEIYEAVDKYLFETYGFTVGGKAHQDLATELIKVIMNIKN